jgi:hypothetical protein
MILTSELFVSALAKTSSGIKLLDHEGNYVRALTPTEAAACSGSGNFQAVGRANRVRYLQPLSKDVLLPVPTPEITPEDDPAFWIGRHLWTWSPAEFGKHRGGIPVGVDGLPV